MERFIAPEDGFKIERAINYLTAEYLKSGRNSKPVILHSIRIGMHLLELNYEAEVVITGILHDLIEDSDVTRSDIEPEFGTDIAGWVMAVSFAPEIKDPIEQYREMFARTIAAGKIPIVVKAADLHANSLYIRMVADVQKQHALLEKIKYFLDLTGAFSGEPALQQLKNRYDKELARH